MTGFASLTGGTNLYAKAPAKAPAPAKVQPIRVEEGNTATDAQMSYLRKLIGTAPEAGTPQAAAATIIEQLLANQRMGKRVASEIIDALKKAPRPAQAQAPKARTNAYAAPCDKCGVTVAPNKGTLGRVEGKWIVECIECPEPLAFPEGYYALRNDEGVVKFYRVADNGTVSVQAGDDLYPVSADAAASIIEAITADPAAASALYGQEIGQCGLCRRTLTDPESIAVGIGPVCRNKAGW